MLNPTVHGDLANPSSMNSSSVSEIATRVGLTDHDTLLKRTCEDDLLPFVAGYFHPWREAAPYLSLREIDIDDVERDHGSESERRLGALRKWKASNGQRATYGVVIKALLTVGRVDNAENICSFLLHGECNTVCVCVCVTVCVCVCV